MSDSEQIPGGYRKPLTMAGLGVAVDDIGSGESTQHELLTRVAGVLARFGTPPQGRQVDIGAAHATLHRVFDTLETLQLRCSVLEAEKSHARQTSESLLRDAIDRIRNLEEVVSALMRLVSRYDALLLESSDRTLDAEHRATYAELRSRDTERGASDAVEWLYRHMANSFDVPR